MTGMHMSYYCYQSNLYRWSEHTTRPIFVPRGGCLSLSDLRQG